MSEDHCEAIVGSHVAQMMEHFDSVRVFVTKHSGPDAQTISYSQGGGCFYSQYGHVREWLVKQDAMARHDATSSE